MRLVKKVVMPLAVAGTVALPSSALAQENSQEEEFTPRTYGFSSGSLYVDDDKEFRDIYGGVWGAKFGVAKDFSKNLIGELAAGIFYKKSEADPYEKHRGEDVDRSLLLLSLEGSFNYFSNPDKKWTLYPKVGFSLTQVRISAGSDSDSGQGLGILLGLGIRNRDVDGSHIFLESLYRSVSSETLDLSGVEFSFGYKRVLGGNE